MSNYLEAGEGGGERLVGGLGVAARRGSEGGENVLEAEQGDEDQCRAHRFSVIQDEESVPGEEVSESKIHNARRGT